MQQKLQIFINEQSVDLGDDKPIAYTLQVNSLADLSTQKASFTKEIQLPLTQKNRRIFGFPDDVNFNTGATYTQYRAKVIQDGIEIIPVGVAEIASVQNRIVNINIIAGNVLFLDELGLGTIYDMNDSQSPASSYGQNLVWNSINLPVPSNPKDPANCVWTVAAAAGSQKNTTGIIWGVIDYGNIGPIDFTVPINVRNMRPAIFVSTVVELLVKNAGYRIDYDKSSLVKLDLYNKLIIPFANDQWMHSSDIQNMPPANGLTTVNSINQNIVTKGVPLNGNGTNTFPFYQQVNFNQSAYKAGTDNISFTANVIFDLYLNGRVTDGGNPTSLTVYFTLIDTDGTATDLDGSLETEIVRGGANYTELGGDGSRVVGEQKFYNLKLVKDIELAPGQQIIVKCHINNQPFGGIDGYAVIYQGATFTVLPKTQDVLWGQNFEAERILPEIGQLDFLKDIFQHFGAICQADPTTNKVIFALFDDIVNNIPNALDWTLKAVDQGKQVMFNIGTFTQVNWLRYTFDDDDMLKLLLPKYFADDKIIIQDKTLSPANPVQDLFTSPYSPSINRPFYGGTIAQILKIDQTTSTTDFSISTVPRILVDEKYTLKQKQDGTGEIVTFADNDDPYITERIVVNDVISIPYFFKPGGQYSLCYCDKQGQPGLKSKFYKGYVKALTESKVVTRYFMLTPYDIASFDFLTPVYLRQENNFFYVGKISDWVKGQPTKVDLIRL